MATRRWLGQARDVAQVDTITVGGTWATSDTITITIGTVDLSITIGSQTTTAQVATTIKQAWNGETLSDTSASCTPTIAQGGAQAMGQFADVVATVASSVVTLTSRVAGTPFTVSTVSETSTSGTLSHSAAATAATGKHFFSNQDNWSANTVPVDGDDIVFDQGNVSCKYGLSPAIQPGSVTVTMQYTGQIGLPEANSDNGSTKTYGEYRTKYLTFDDNTATCTYRIGEGDVGPGSGLIRIDAGAGQSILLVKNTGNPTVTGQPAFLFIGTHADNAGYFSGGESGVAFFAGEAATIKTLAIGAGAVTSNQAKLTVGSGATINGSGATTDVAAGTVVLHVATLDLDMTGGFVSIERGAHTDINVDAGTLYYNTNGTATTVRVGSAGVFDKSRDMRATTITNAVQMYRGATFKDPHGVVTLSGGIKLNRCRVEDVKVDVAVDRTLSVT